MIRRRDNERLSNWFIKFIREEFGYGEASVTEIIFEELCVQEQWVADCMGLGINGEIE